MEHTYQTVDELQSVKWRDELVLTTAQLAEFYETSVDNIWQNFHRNRDRFIDGKHFFKLEGDNLRTFKHNLTNCHAQTGNNLENCQVAGDEMYCRLTNCQVAGNVNVLYLWTKRGAARHAKMLNTDRAWDVFELLEDAYFNRAAEDNSTLPGADFWWEVKQPHKPTDFERGVQLKKLSSHTHNPETRELLIREAANLIAGEKIFTV